MNWYKKAYVDGEYWIDEDGNAHFADGDIGDMDHTTYVINRIISDWLDIDSEELDISEILNSPDDQLLSAGMPQEAIDAMKNKKDPREYAMKQWGWVRVSDRFVQSWYLTSQMLNRIANGLYDAFDRDVYTEQAWVLESMSNGKIYENIPYEVITQGNPMALRGYQMADFSRYASNNWYKKAQFSKKLLKNINKKKQISLQNGWTPEEVEWAGQISAQLSDPSYFMWLLNQTRNSSANIQTGEDNEKILIALDKFQKLKDKKMLSPEQSNINQIKSFSELSRVLSSFEKGQAYVTEDSINTVDGAKVIYAEENVSVVQVDTFEAGEKVFSDGWCVKFNKDHFYKTYGPPYLMFNLHNRPYALYCRKTGDFMDEHDHPMDVKKTLPLIKSLRDLSQTEHIEESGQNIISEVLIKENQINIAAKNENLMTVYDILGQDSGYAHLIKKANLNEKVIDVVNRKFEQDYNRLPDRVVESYVYHNAKKISKFFDNMPYYLNENNFSVTDGHLEIIENFVKNDWRDYPDLGKQLKTKKVKDIATNSFKEDIKRQPSVWWDYNIPELKTPDLKEYTYNVIKEFLLGERQYKVNSSMNVNWLVDDLPDEFKTGEIKQILFERSLKDKIQYIQRYPHLYDELEEEYKIPELEKARTQGYKNLLGVDDYGRDIEYNPDANNVNEYSWKQIPDEHKTPELVHFYNELKLRKYKAFLSVIENTVKGTSTEKGYYDRLKQYESDFHQSNYYPGQPVQSPPYQQQPQASSKSWYKRAN